jgi:hypothetical protein
MASITPLSELTRHLNLLYKSNGDSFHLMLMNMAATGASRTFATTDVNTSTNVVTVPSSDYAVGTCLRFETTGVLPAPLVAETAYYVASVASTTQITVATLTTAGAIGSAIDLTTQGSGTHTAVEVTPGAIITGSQYNLFLSVANLERYEIAAYPTTAGSTSNRPTVSPASPSILVEPDAALATRSHYAVLTVPILLDNTNGANITYSGCAIIRGGSATPGNTTGTVAQFFRFDSTQTIVAASATGQLNYPLYAADDPAA